MRPSDYEEVAERLLYRGIPSVGVNWSHSTERFFSNARFMRIVNRSEECGAGVNGLEVFSDFGQLLCVAFSPAPDDRGAKWCRSVLDEYNDPGFLFSATYTLPGVVDQSGMREDLQSDSGKHEMSLADFVEGLARCMYEGGETSSALHRKH